MPKKDVLDEAIHRLLLSGKLVQVDRRDPATGEYLLWTPERAREAGLRIVPYDPLVN